MKLYRALFTTDVGALTAVIRASKAQGVSAEVITKKGKVVPVYKRGQLLGYHAVYPTIEGKLRVVKETYDGSQKCYHLKANMGLPHLN